MSTFTANLNVMMKTARLAGRSLVRDFNEVENLQVSSKSAGDFVSKADLRSEKIIYKELIEARKNYGFLGEEGTEVVGTDPTRRWIVDPLDGTTNFLHGMPHWSVSIALEHRGEIVSGVIYDPVKDEMYVAEKGAGAWLNDNRIRVSDRSDMIKSVFATGIPFAGNPALPNFLQQVARISPTCAGLRRWGAASLDLAYVASGRYEGFWEVGLKPWDMAAGMIIVKEAGGFVDSVAGNTDPMVDGTVIAGNSALYDRFSALIRG